MKKMKVLGLIALVMVVGFAMVACDDGTDCDHEWGEWDITPATLALEGERSRVCTVEGCEEEDFEKIPRWTALYNTTWNNGGSQYLKITATAFQLNITTPAGITVTDKIDFEISKWEYAELSANNGGLTGDATAFKISGVTKEKLGAFADDYTEIKINVTVAGGQMKMHYTSSENVSGQTFVPIAAW